MQAGGNRLNRIAGDGKAKSFYRRQKFVRSKLPVANVHILVDVPNINSTIKDMLGRIPDKYELPHYRNLTRWVSADARKKLPGYFCDVQLSLFLNVRNQRALRHYTAISAEFGWNIVAMPHRVATDDIDEELAKRARYYLAEGLVDRFYFVGQDLRNFVPLIGEAQEAGVRSELLYFPGMVLPATSVRINLTPFPGDKVDLTKVEKFDVQAIPGFVSI